MIVKDLIAALKSMPANAVVVGRGYEDGYDDVDPPRLIEVVDSQGPGVKKSWWTGRYDDPWGDDDAEKVAVVVIS